MGKNFDVLIQELLNQTRIGENIDKMDIADPTDLEGQQEAYTFQNQKYQIRTRASTWEQTKILSEVRRLNTIYNPATELAEFILLSAKLKTVELEKFKNTWFNPNSTDRVGQIIASNPPKTPSHKMPANAVMRWQKRFKFLLFCVKLS
jgi:hypothetical protein